MFLFNCCKKYGLRRMLINARIHHCSSKTLHSLDFVLSLRRGPHALSQDASRTKHSHQVYITFTITCKAAEQAIFQAR